MSLQVSSAEVVQAYIDRIQEVNPFLNAVVKDRQERIISPHLILYFFVRQNIGSYFGFVPFKVIVNSYFWFSDCCLDKTRYFKTCWAVGNYNRDFFF